MTKLESLRIGPNTPGVIFGEMGFCEAFLFDEFRLGIKLSTTSALVLSSVSENITMTHDVGINEKFEVVKGIKIEVKR